MPFIAYPSADDIELVLKSNAIWPEGADAQQLARRQALISAEGAAAQFENLTGWGPTLAGWSPDGEVAARDENGDLVGETRYFDGGDHNGDLNLKGGLLRLDSISINGTLQTRDFAPYFHRFTRRESSPIIAIRGAFFGHRGGVYGGGYGSNRGNSIAITGVWGKFWTLPADVFEVCQHKAIANMMDYILNEQSIGSLSMESFSKSLDITGVRTQQNIAETGAKGFNDLCSTHVLPYLS